MVFRIGIQYSLTVLLFSPALAGAAANCGACEQAENGAQVFCQLNADKFKGTLPAEDRRLAKDLQDRYKSAVARALKAEQEKSPVIRSEQVSSAADDKAKLVTEIARSCATAYKKARTACQRTCFCVNCDSFKSKYKTWVEQADADRNYAQRNREIADENRVRALRSSTREQAPRRGAGRRTASSF